MLILTSFNALNPSQYRLKTVVIDAGHGGKDPGARGKISWEKDIALAISLELGRILKENMPAINVVYTRKDDRFLTLYKRSEIANNLMLIYLYLSTLTLSLNLQFMVQPHTLWD